MPDLRCKNKYCAHYIEDSNSSLMWPGKCGNPPDNKVIITETGECETYWYAVSCGKGEDIRKISLKEDPKLEPMYKRP